jgi:hypothetical protein
MRILLRGNLSSIEVERSREMEILLVAKPNCYCETWLNTHVLLVF